MKRINLALKVIPPVQFTLSAMMMYLTAPWLPKQELLLSMGQPIAIVFVIVAITLGLSAVLRFKRVGTTVEPHQPEKTSVLVTNGIYRYSRNPMYLSLVLLLCAFLCYLGSILLSVYIVFFIWYITTFQIKPEEQILTQRFGQAYIEYCQRVGRWL
jgi:protein-S-isoprenylcysteine O-methyltransferase Ste14